VEQTVAAFSSVKELAFLAAAPLLDQPAGTGFFLLVLHPQSVTQKHLEDC
jgi:hypothetical protein